MKRNNVRSSADLPLYPALAMRSTGMAAGLLLSAASAGCGLEAPAPELAAEAQPIINGTAVTDAERLQRGLVGLPNCSAVLLANDWVLTAGHCVNGRDRTSVTAGLPGDSISSDAIYKFGNDNDPRGADLALVHLQRPFTINGSTTGFSTRLYQGPPASMGGKVVASYGQGNNVLPSSGFGTWRAGDLPVSAVVGEGYSLLPNASGQITWTGDSGGPDFVWQGGVPYLTGIHSGVNYTCTDPTTPETCKATATAVTSSSSVSIAAMRDAMAAVLSTSWDARWRVQGLLIRSPEIAATRWGGFSDLRAVGWAQAARSSDAMCYNRGFASGRFAGPQDPALGRYEVHCDGPGTAWFDVSQADINATGWGFADVNTVAWAQSHRAAERLCAWRGFVGGHFNGQMSGGRFGLLCYRDEARWFDVPRGEIDWGAYPVWDVNSVPWSQASTAALVACRPRGYASGFLNGHQGPATYGLVCLR